jgi:hypothetical protein
VDDVNNMDDSIDPVELPNGRLENAFGTSVDRRTMLKAAVAAGTFAGTWVAPHIETFGFAPAAAATQCVVENTTQQDLTQNDANNTYVSTGYTRCAGNGSASFGPSGGQPDRIRFGGGGNAGPAPSATCPVFVARTVPADCSTVGADLLDPDVTGFAVVRDNAPGQTSSGCECFISSVTIYTSNRQTILTTVNLSPATAHAGCASYNTGPGILMDATTMGINPCTGIPMNARLAVTISCQSTVPC